MQHTNMFQQRFLSGFRSLRYAEIQIKFAGLTNFEICSVYLILCNRWFCVESGSADKHPVILIHGFPSQVNLLFV